MRDFKGNSINSAIVNQINDGTREDLLGLTPETQDAGWRSKDYLASSAMQPFCFKYSTGLVGPL